MVVDVVPSEVEGVAGVVLIGEARGGGTGCVALLAGGCLLG